MSWNIGDIKKRFLKIKWELGLHHVVFVIPKNSGKKLTLTVVERQHLLDIEKTDFKEVKPCQNI